MKVIQYITLHDCRFLCPQNMSRKNKNQCHQNNSIPSEFWKQHYTGEKECMDCQSFSPCKFGHFQEHRGWVHAKQSIMGDPLAFILFCPGLVEDSKTDIHHTSMDEVKLYKERLDDFTIRNFLFSPSWWPTWNRNTTLGICQASICW